MKTSPTPRFSFASWIVRAPLLLLLICGVFGCATESHVALTPDQVNSAGTLYNGPKQTVVVSKFDNHSNYMQGLFSNGVDQLGSQAQTILVSYLESSGHFQVVDRTSKDAQAQEAAINGTPQKLTGANFIVTGDVVEFGRKETGDVQLFGILGSGKKQVAYAKVALNVVDVSTSQVVFTAQGSGEYDLSNREVIGFGGTAGYDSTLNGKVLSLAIREAVNRLVDGSQNGTWIAAPATK